MDTPRLDRRPSVLPGLARGVVLKLTLMALAALIAWPVQPASTIAVLALGSSVNGTFRHGARIRFETTTVPGSLTPGEILRPRPAPPWSVALPLVGDGSKPTSVSVRLVSPR